MNNDVTGFCTKWYYLGLQLLEEHNGARILIEIECNCPNNASRCCMKMFEKWLEQQPHPSWNQLLTALVNLGMNNAAEQIIGIVVALYVCIYVLCRNQNYL